MLRKMFSFCLKNLNDYTVKALGEHLCVNPLMFYMSIWKSIYITTVSDRQFKHFSVVLLQFDKPGARDNYDYPDMAKEAGAYSNNYSGRCSVAQKMIWMSVILLRKVCVNVLRHCVFILCQVRRPLQMQESNILTLNKPLWDMSMVSFKWNMFVLPKWNHLDGERFSLWS